MAIKVSDFKINNTQVWIIIQPLYTFHRQTLDASEDKGFLCYFNFSDPFNFKDGEPINLTEAELIYDKTNKPKIFLTETEIELYALNYIKRKIKN